MKRVLVSAALAILFSTSCGDRMSLETAKLAMERNDTDLAIKRLEEIKPGSDQYDEAQKLLKPLKHFKQFAPEFKR